MKKATNLKLAQILKILRAKSPSLSKNILRNNSGKDHNREANLIADNFPFKGFQENRNHIKFIDFIKDQDLEELNKILNWNCFVVDSNGRRFGSITRLGKRDTPQTIPDERILLMNEYFHLADKHVLEIGCFEGVHTIGLAQYAQEVTAFDSRIENVVKAIVRCALFGYHPKIFQFNIEEYSPEHLNLFSADVMHHVGVLYHLQNPVKHLLKLKEYIRVGIMLDTHYALEEEATEVYEVNGKKYYYKPYQEKGYADVFSGMYEASKWLKLDDIISLLQEAGFIQVDIVEKRAERNGARVLIVAKKSI